MFFPDHKYFGPDPLKHVKDFLNREGKQYQSFSDNNNVATKSTEELQKEADAQKEKLKAEAEKAAKEKKDWEEKW